MARHFNQAPAPMSKLPDTPTAPTDTLPAPDAVLVAGVLRRLAALVYDAFLLFGLLVVPLFIATAILSPRQNLPQGAVTHELPSIAPKPVLLAYIIIVIVGFYCYFWRTSGQTLGMQAWRIRIENADGERPTWRQCFMRAIVGFASLLSGGLGYWWIWLDKNRASWHDRASNTRVVVLPKNNASEEIMLPKK
jgi:uncharacterized RDD family membrane protein YckC